MLILKQSNEYPRACKYCSINYVHFSAISFKEDTPYIKTILNYDDLTDFQEKYATNLFPDYYDEQFFQNKLLVILVVEHSISGIFDICIDKIDHKEIMINVRPKEGFIYFAVGAYIGVCIELDKNYFEGIENIRVNCTGYLFDYSN